jgi:hypothetical protein
MQLIRYYFIVLSLLLSFTLVAQEQPEPQSKIGEVEVDILSSYYEQDGDHGALLGGIGSQMLTDKTAGIQVNVPIDTVNVLNMSMNWDLYTSASSNQIDEVVTGASSRDYRSYGNISYTRLLKMGNSISLGGGFSNEFDVKSKSVNLGYSYETENRNTSIDLHAKAYFDNWKLIFPSELRYYSDTFNLPDTRSTYSAAISLSQVINKKLQGLIIYEFTSQKGLLSTPFHRVYFNDGVDVFTRTEKIEKLPETRVKHAIGARISWYLNDYLISRFFYRYYFDSYKITSHTASIELPVKLTRFFSVYPFYRYYSQTGYEFFKPYGEHDITQEFYTSDYDLSSFYSQKVGVGLRLSPPFGIFSFRNKILFNRTQAFKGFELRYGKYLRSDGLNAYFVSGDLTFSF